MLDLSAAFQLRVQFTNRQSPRPSKRASGLWCGGHRPQWGRGGRNDTED